MFQTTTIPGKKILNRRMAPRREPRSIHFHAKDLFDSTHSQHFSRQGDLT